MVVEVPVPVVVTNPGVLVKVQVPLDGKPLNTTLPVVVAHVGCVMVPTVGALGAVGCASMTIVDELEDTHDDALVTV
jgi:hypothetical protein